MSPELWGRVDLAKNAQGCSTLRNFFCNYRGGASSRAGYAYVGTSKQSGTSYPPRLVNFQFNLLQGYCLEFGHQYLRIISNGAYVTEATKVITGVSHANPAVLTVVAHGYSVGDWGFIAGVGGVTQLNGLYWIVASTPTADTLSLTDLFGNPLDTTTLGLYTSGGTMARVYTLVTPYAAVDLLYLKFTQSADTMSICCVNQQTGTEYPPYDLKRNGATSWALTQLSFASSIAAPAGLNVTAHNSTTVDTWYSYVVTAIDAVTSDESVASNFDSAENNNIAIFAGSNSLQWGAVAGASSYNVYKATPSYNVDVPVGSSYGYAGYSFGPSFSDTNITADFTKTPPLHKNPFARGSITSVNVTASGTGYTQAGTTFSIATASGTGFVGVPIIDGGAVVGFIVENGGQNYANGDTITFTANGTGATATLAVGPVSGTYPGVVAYFQQRRVYASTLNQPDTYFMSQPGSYKNFDSATPTVDDDAITGTPWAQQINGIQFLVPMPGGLVVLTGSGSWQISGDNGKVVTPADQTATPQAYNGCNATVPPIVSNSDILYVQAKGSIVRDLSYNFFTNIYTGTDLTVLSNHLFAGHTIISWAYAEEPYKLIWCVRDDGIMLSLTYLKEQDVYGWSRHDTNGLFQSVCSVTEPPVDAVYAAVKRYVQGQWMYYIERMDNRNWTEVEDCWCVDAGLAYPMTNPAATLTPAAADGTANITSVNLVFGGHGYTNPSVEAIGPGGVGTGAAFAVALSGGVITGITPITSGENYAGGTELNITDPTGSGAVAYPIITNNVTFDASAGVFSAGNVGDIIRVGGGRAAITSYVSPTQVIANITVPITAVILDDNENADAQPIPQVSGNWSVSTPTTSVTGLNHLNGKEVAILADGSVIPNQTVVNNTITLPQAYSQITVGLPFRPQLQTLYINPPPQNDGTSQSKRKNISAVTVRMQGSRGMRVGTNQPDASTQPNSATVPWKGMLEFKGRSGLVPAGQSMPLVTGDERLFVTSEWSEKGQVAVDQPFCLPANLDGLVFEYSLGDTPG